jgi:hypothetical protein
MSTTTPIMTPIPTPEFPQILPPSASSPAVFAAAFAVVVAATAVSAVSVVSAVSAAAAAAAAAALLFVLTQNGHRLQEQKLLPRCCGD